MKKLLVIITFIVSLFSVQAQEQENIRAMFLEAESYFLFQEYNEAIGLYLQLKPVFSDNQNINYKIGVCYLNNPFSKEKSIYYLEQAITNISEKYKDNSIKETSAPQDALFYLGDAYRVNGRLDTAIATYEKFLNIVDPEVYDIELVKDQINACKNAKTNKLKYSSADMSNLGDLINDAFSQTNPVISGDEKSMMYVSKLKFYDAIFYSINEDGTWKAPRNIIPELKIDGNAYPTSLNYDGTKMYLYRNDNYDGNIWVSVLKNGEWAPPAKLNENINTKYWESHASTSRDDKTLYFTSNRPGGYGDLDIYISKRDETDQWGPARNLGPIINSKYNEEEPVITVDGNRLYFTSYGHETNGGYDIFFSELDNRYVWQTPVNLGFPINSTDDDRYFYPYRNGDLALMSFIDPRGHGQYDINSIEIFAYRKPKTINIVTRLAKSTGDETIADKLALKVYNKRSNELILTREISADDSLTAKLKTGDYSIAIEGKNIHALTRNFTVDSTLNQQISLKDTLKALSSVKKSSNKKPAVKPLVVVPFENKLYSLNNQELTLPIKVTPQTELSITVYNNGQIIQLQHEVATDSLYNFVVHPREGVNKVIIKAKNNNQEKTISVNINYEAQQEVKEPIAENTLDDSVKLLFINELLTIADKNLIDIITRNKLALEEAANIDDIYASLKNLSLKANIDPSAIDSLFSATLKNSVANYYNSIINQDIANRNGDSSLINVHVISLENNILEIKTIDKNLELTALFTYLAKINNINSTELKSWAIKNLNKEELNFINKILETEPDILLALKKIAQKCVSTDKYASIIDKLTDYLLLKDLIEQLKHNSIDALKAILDTLNVEKNNLYTTNDFVNYLHKVYTENFITYNEMLKTFSEVSLLANNRVIPTETAQVTKTTKGKWKIIYWGALIFVIFFLLYKRRKKKIEQQKHK